MHLIKDATEGFTRVEPVPKRIALIGSAPSSIHLAPYNDPSWTIWGCSSGAAQHVKRLDAWFEIHPFSTPDVPREYMTPDYVAWLQRLTVPIHVIEPVEELPTSVAYPREEMEQKYGQYFFTNSIAFMFAMALEQNPQEIGLWGVDMSAVEEWSYQRPACHHFVQLARDRGIKVTVPPQSDLLHAPAPYGFCMTSPMYLKLHARAHELDSRIQQAAEKYEAARNEWNFLKGARDDLEYVLKTWLR